MIRYFPQGIATDSTFCNRHKERAALRNSIQMHEHIVLVAPRRYGKTSLVMQVLKENDFPGVCIDFFFVLTQAEVLKTIIEGISSVISKLLPLKKTASQKIINAIAELNPKLSFSLLRQKLEISTKQTTEKSISELLLALDQFAVQANKSCVVVFDEFQQIGELKENHAVKAAIRHAVERSQNVSYIFCGSKRHLLNEMFSDKSRPLYHLCDLMTIDRIEFSSYHVFLQHMAKTKWKKELSEDAITEIVHLTENHSYYVNALCRRLWRENHPPTLGEVRIAWNNYVTQQRDWMSNDLTQLTLNRRKVLTALAYEPTHFILGQDFCNRVGLNPSSINRTISDLQKSDLIYQDTDGFFRLLDPCIAYFIRENSIR